MVESIAIAILGSSGKMGQKIAQLADEDFRFVIRGMAGRDCVATALQHCQVGIDFSHADATLHHLAIAKELKKPLVIGTTGLSPQTQEALQQAASLIPILYSPNFSIGIALCLEAAALFGKALQGKGKISIYETHHTRKKDKPSGTALALAAAVGKGEEVPIYATREGDTIGDHRLVLEWEEERIVLEHQALSRDCFAKGALLAAQFLYDKPPGLYTLQDVYK